jgi:ectoine hydroxylase-related dioxygenase (phytanoyl-CoA dioxygenase family)
MHTTLTPPDYAPASCGYPLDLSPDAFGELEDSNDYLGNPEALRARLAENGYLLLRDYLDPDEVMNARRSVTDRLAEKGQLHPDHAPIDGFAIPGVPLTFVPYVARENPEVENLVYGKRLLSLYDTIFGRPSAHFDFTWFRAIGPGKGSTPHCDWPYMNRGTKNLLTCWIPYGEVSLQLGGLMVLEKSHLKADRLKKYFEIDVDSYCENRPSEVERAKAEKWVYKGNLSNNPVSLREKLGGRWLTTEYRPGDLLTFPMTMIHASLDNHTDRIRFSSDTRYLPDGEVRDERWIGPNPPGHTFAGKRGRIC